MATPEEGARENDAAASASAGAQSEQAGAAHAGERSEEERGPFSFISWLRRSHPEPAEDKAPPRDEPSDVDDRHDR
jgi:hypothetical protein